MSDRPSPLTPADCELHGFDWMPLMCQRLFASRWYVLARRNSRGALAGLKLWWVAFLQKPAASLPDDELELCMLADFGEDVKAWRKHREVAMHGFILCSDGRWYHPVVAEAAIDSYDRKLKAIKGREGDRDRLKQWRARKRSETDGEMRFTPPPETPKETPNDTPPETAAERGFSGVVQDRTEEDKERAKPALFLPELARENGGRDPANGAGPPRWGDRRIVPHGLHRGKPADDPINIRDRDRPLCNGTLVDWLVDQLQEITGIHAIPIADKTMIQWLADGYEPDAILAAIRRVVERPDFTPKPLSYFDKPVREQPPTWHPLPSPAARRVA